MIPSELGLPPFVSSQSVDRRKDKYHSVVTRLDYTID